MGQFLFWGRRGTSVSKQTAGGARCEEANRGGKSSYSECENRYMNDRNPAVCSVKTEEVR